MTRSNPLALAFFATALAAGASTAMAVTPPGHMQARPAVELADKSAPPVRAVRDVSANQMPQRMMRPWVGFATSAGGQWSATWDRSTGVPNRVWGSGIAVPGAVASDAVAAAHATGFLDLHRDLLAPGSSSGEFTLVSNVVRRGVRTVGFVQTHQGMEVLGGQVSFRYKNDRLIAIGSEALPNVSVKVRRSTTTDSVARASARAWLERDVAQVATAGAVEGPFILPLVTELGVHEYRIVMRVRADATRPFGRWNVWVDADSGAPVARESAIHFADGSLLYNVPDRFPDGSRSDYPARAATVTIDGNAVTSGEDGSVTWAGDASGDLVTSIDSALVNVDNVAGDDASILLSIPAGGTATWNPAGDELIEAQVNSFIHARLVKEYARNLAPELAWLDEQLPVNVNIDETCNAFSDGNSINFFVASTECANTAQLADVVYHEFGHSLHANSVIEGVGAFTSAHSEGLSDYLAATITDDPAMGRGFFNSQGPLRHIDPSGKEHVWPDDVAGAHFTGLIFAGAMWDLRKLLIDKYGRTEGVPLSDRLYYATLERATSIPSTYVEVLVEDDDDGDLSNGTPNACEINAAFSAHGLRTFNAQVSALAAEAPSQDGHTVSLQVSGLFEQCPGDRVSGASIEWHLRDDDNRATVEMTEAGELFAGTIPAIPPGSVVQYKVRVSFSDGQTRSFPDNLADPEYEFFVGEVVELYCTGFETDPFAEGWVHELVSGEAGDGADDWTWGAPQAPEASGDPPTAFLGNFVIGNDLGGEDFNGSYQADKVNFAMSPVVEVGDYTDVHLQYWRWLNVEDAFFDQGEIFVNDRLAWQNFNSDNGNDSTIHHQDREWRFHDVPVSKYAIDEGTVQVKYQITSDGGLELGGWTIDEFCIVAYAGSVCGDGNVTGIETCDAGDANSDTEPDGCRENCQQAFCGDGVIDDGETCDDGNDVNDDGCNNACSGDGEPGGGGDCGCDVGGRSRVPATGTLLLALSFGMVWLVRRRRRRGK